MRRWLMALATSAVTTVLAVVINLATGNEDHLWTWLVVAALAVLVAAVTVWTQHPPTPTPIPAAASTSMGGTENTVSGSPHSHIVQAGHVDSITINTTPPPPTSIPETPTPAVAGSRVWNIPLRNPHFTGRTDLLDRLETGLRGADRSVVTVHSLRGMGGVGKTQLAIEYAHCQAERYDLAWWIPAEQPELIPNHLAGLGARLGVVGVDEVATAGRVVEELRGRSRWLLVFDNAEDPDALRPYLPGSGGDVLVTTRRTGFGSLGGELDVDVLPRAESVALLRKRVAGVTEAQADRLAEWVGDLPLALEQAAAYVDTTRLPVEEYLGLLAERGGDMLGEGTVGGYRHTLATVWSLSLTRIGEQCPAAVELLGLCAYLAPEAIPLDLFTAHPQQLPVGLAAAVGDRLVWANTVGVLVEYALVRRSGAGLSVHRLVQTALRHQHASGAPDGELVPWLGRVVALLRADLPAGIVGAPEDWPRWRQLLPHVLTATEWPGGAVVPEAGAWLLDRAATYLRVHGQPAQARPLFERALAINEATYGPHHPEVATDLNNLGGALRALGQPAQARPLYERALAIDEATYGPHHPEVATDLNNLGGALRALGQPAQARPLYERALAITEATYGPHHPTVAIRLNNLGEALRDLGQPAQARPLHERALAIDEATYGPHHPEVATDLNNLGGALRALGQPAQARPLYERALAITEATYGPHHPTVAIIRRNLSSLDG